ncbi:MAG: NUDIX hydrolase [Candidatus Pacebacteria bacterium]|nr:NUDIX hydrolase [Candidatus Paceibacterota bacterium]MDR3583611.1 NUDIX hydrolase [Candidatus Paceibacterota bacterium]
MIKKSIVVILGIIENEKGEILLSLRNDPKFPGAHLKWDLIGGKNEMGEGPEETLVREAKEESGLKIAVSELLPQCICKNWERPGHFQHTLVFCYGARKLSGRLVSDGHKIDELKWVTPQAALEMDLIFSARIFIELYLEQRPKHTKNRSKLY